MRWLYMLSVYIHILAAIVWIGGMAFLMLIVVPYLRSGDRATAARVMSATGRRFRSVGWVCFGLVLVTGSFNLWSRGVRLSSFGDRAWLATPFAHAVLMKLGVFGLVLSVSAVHDFWLGPRATALLERAPGAPAAARMRRTASLIGRVNALLALLLIALGEIIVRGWP
jgi:uncharacterized membrane protein